MQFPPVEEQLAIIRRGVEKIVPEEELAEKLKKSFETGVPLRIKYGIDPTHMALQWTRTRPVPTIPIFGATTLAQLQHILQAPAVTLPDELLAEVSKAHRAHPMPY